MAADETIAIDIFIKADKSQQTLGDLRKGFKALEEELEKTDRSTKEGAKRFKELSTAMAQTGKETKNIELAFESLDSENVASEMGSVAGAVGDVTASMILLGGESETMKEFANTIQTAIGVSMGFKGAIEGLSSARKLHNNLLKQSNGLTLRQIAAQKISAVGTKIWAAATAAAGVVMKAFNAIMNLNPIGLIVIALGLAAVAFAAFKGVLGDVVDFLMRPFKAAFDLAVDVLQFFGVVESDQAEKSRKAAEKRSSAQRKMVTEIIKETERLVEASKDATDKLIADIDRDIQRRQAAGEEFRDLTTERLNTIAAGLAEEIRLNQEAVDKLSEVEAEAIKNKDTFTLLQTLQQKDQKLLQLKDQKEAQVESNFSLELHEIESTKIESDNAKIRSDNKKERDAKALEAERKRLDDLRKLREENGQNIRRFDKQRADLSLNDEVEEKKASLSAQTWYNDESIRIFKEAHDKKIEDINKENEARQKSLAVAQAGLDILSASADLFVKDEIKRDKIRKALAVAQLAIDTARAISSGIASAMTQPFPLNLVAVLSTVASVISNMAQAKQLLQSAGAGSVSLPSGGASAGGGTNISPVSNTSTLTGGTPNPVVSVEEINTVSNKVDAIEQAATIG